ncbi:ADP-ribosylation factor-like protein 2-binding protein [Blattella germanica]|nr:ADP-ribosylation factor-like protein 2-binding protein [Blattella germanica]
MDYEEQFQEGHGEGFFTDDLGIVTTHGSAEDAFFDSVIGHIEDILMEEGFQHLQRCFMEKYWHEFDDNEENKLCYMEIFQEYINVIERHIETHLANKIPNFSMQRFIEQLQ